MKANTNFAFLMLTALMLATPAHAQVVINEVMAQNSNTLADPDFGESADWVELHNCGLEDIDLSGCGITDKLSTPLKYVLPQGTILAAGDYLLLWCDDQSAGLHTNFKLSADGECVALFSSEGVLMDSISFGVQLLDISYGRRRDATDEWAFFLTPTPGAKNAVEAYMGKANQPMILTPGGFFRGAATTSITNDLGGTVHYTTDGSEPTAASPVYEGPLTFEKTTVLRARIIEEGKIPGNVVTASYFIDDAFEGHHLPIVSIATDDENFWDNEQGIYVQDFKPDWEVPVNIELFLNNGSDRPAFNERAGIKVNGLYSWQLPQKMLGVYFKKKYGESKLEYQLFVDDSRASFDNFALRASGSDWSYTLMRDGLVQQAARRGGMNLDLMAFRPCVVYVNGEFLGIHNIREKVDEDYVTRHYDLGGAPFDMVEGGDEAEVGNIDAWVEFLKRAKATDYSDDTPFEALKQEIDLENFTDYIITQSYSANTSLSHNTMTWKTCEGGKWRWILMDCDRGFFKFDNSNINYVVKQSFWPLSQMLQNEGYRQYFCQRMADQLFTTFNADEICRQIDEHQADIEPIIRQHVERWQGTTSDYGDALPSVDYWRDEVEELRDFARGRVTILLDDLSSYGAEKPALLSLASQPEEACLFCFNGHPLPRTHWNGLYPMQMDITLTAEDRAGYVFRGWRQTQLTDLIARGSEWRYLDNGSNQGEAWRQPDFDDEAWSSGAAPLGYKCDNIQTTLPSGSKSSKPYTTYFRRHFSVDDPAAIRRLKVQLCREDAAAVYINGQRIINSNLPLQGLNYKTKSLIYMDDYAGYNYLAYDIPTDALVEGDNIIAVEVHQTSSTSSDLAFDLQLQAETLEPNAPLLGTDTTLRLRLEGDMGVVAMYEPDGQNILPDTIHNDMLLRKSLSPYLVARDVVVAPEARLTIEPGVTLLFSPQANMIVHGAITAEGTPEDSILFRLNPIYDESMSWGAVCFINTDDRVSSISYAELRDGSRGPAEYNCVAVLSGFATTLQLDHLRITDTDANPIACRYSDVRLTNSLLHAKITGDLINVKYGKATIADCEFIGNDQIDTDAIDYDGVEGGVIRRSIIHDFLGNNSDAIDIGEQATNVCIDSVLIYDITDKGISVGQRSSVRVTNCTFIQTCLGLGVKDSCRAEVDRCTFYAVQTPIASYEKVLGRAGGNVTVTASVFANSFVADVERDDKSTVRINNSLSDTSSLPFGTDNTMADPAFVAPTLYDFSSASPLLLGRGSSFLPQRPEVQPVIAEICYAPDALKGETEYVAIHNAGSADIDLSGYRFSRGFDFSFPEGVVLSAGDTLFIVAESSVLSAGQEQLVWNSGKLANEGEAIELTAPTGIIVDQVHYLPTAPWPLLQPDRPNVVQLNDALRANHIAANWSQKPSTQPDHVTNFLDATKQQSSYDLQGRPTSGKPARGIIIIGDPTNKRTARTIIIGRISK
ncbi:MAG: lamin tail domain-containing protein [Bacteroidaceae bacterium]|nr:lamin tail domain-containing protein [Bacteroidaceae bacterium]